MQPTPSWSRSPREPEPTDGGDDAMPLTVDLETADGHDVYVDIIDRYGLLESAESGHPAEGMSVEPYTLEIENVDERTLKLTWVDFGIDNALELHFFQDGKVLVMVQPEPAGDTDAIGSRPGADPHLRGADLGRRHRRLPAGRPRHAG